MELVLPELVRLEKRKREYDGPEYAKRKRSLLEPLSVKDQLKVREDQDAGMDEWIRRHEQSETIEENEDFFRDSVKEMRRFVPPDVLTSSLSKLRKMLGKELGQRMWRRRALWLCRMHPQDICKLHIADLVSKFDNQGLDIVELRAAYASLPKGFGQYDVKKAEWKMSIKVKLDELERKRKSGRLKPNEERHSAYREKKPIFNDEDGQPFQRIEISAGTTS